ncbi:MAG: radical SAM protein [Lachnospiraceae bacterium]|nr:radical SAM protein [Butyrivibrio sp.]MCM1410272.1 radical SAM protein [Lachnospiraceae bacterium]
MEDRIQEIVSEFDPTEEYIIYGTGECFRFMQWIFGDLLKIKFCIDKRAYAEPYQIGTISVYAPEKLRDHKNDKIIIAANGEYYFEIKEELEKLGHRKELLCSAFEISAVWGMKYKQMITSMYVSFPVLSACTLNCNGCIHYTGYHKKGFYLKKEEIAKSVDLYFKCVDLVDQIQIFGGEPFLHKELGEICLYISEHYAGRYHKMLVTTNGTIVPTEKDVQCLKKCSDLSVSISDYSQTNEDRLKIEQLIEVCENEKIDHIVNSDFFRTDSKNLWFDCGDPTQKKNGMDVKQRFAECTLSGSGVFGDRYYYCPNSMFAEITDIFPAGQDWMDLKQISHLSKQEQFYKILAWHWGFMESGKLDFCSFCAGFGKKVNSDYIKAGMQL